MNDSIHESGLMSVITRLERISIVDIHWNPHFTKQCRCDAHIIQPAFLDVLDLARIVLFDPLLTKVRCSDDIATLKQKKRNRELVVISIEALGYPAYVLESLDVMGHLAVEFLVKHTIEIIPMRSEDHVMMVIIFSEHWGFLLEGRGQYTVQQASFPYLPHSPKVRQSSTRKS